MDTSEKRYLELLSKTYPTAAKASAKIIGLDANLNLPRGTEFFVSDIHGEFNAFSHILRNGSGSIRLKIDEVFGDTLSDNEKRSLATLIYYPRERMKIVIPKAPDPNRWYSVTLTRLIAICRRAARKHTREKVSNALPEVYAYIIEELMNVDEHDVDKKTYYAAIVRAAIESGCADDLVEAICHLIQRLAVDRLHVIGDVYDRGPAPHKIMEMLIDHYSVDIQWGNHDIVWMGASLGQRGCIAHVVRNCARYGNLSILEDAYGINLRPLAKFATEAYADDPCVAFGLKENPGLSEEETELNVKIQKAMAIMQFKVEAALIDENPSFKLESRKLLDKIDWERGTVMVDGVEYELTDTVFPTVDKNDPYKLTDGEEAVMRSLEHAFTGCEKLQRHMRFMLEKGSLYKISNGDLLLHACVPLNPDGSPMEVELFGEKLSGRTLYDAMERYVRAAFSSTDPEMRKRGRDVIWYLWLGEGSPLFAKSKMATFEIYLVADKAARKEVKNPFYSLLDDEAAIRGIVEDFGLDPEHAHIICGHVPVKVKDGVDPVRCGGRVLMIDGGFSKAYQPTTGIAGFTLIENSYGLMLDAHEPLESTEAAISDEVDMVSDRRIVERFEERSLVASTDAGDDMRCQIEELNQLIEAYRNGDIAERKDA